MNQPPSAFWKQYYALRRPGQEAVRDIPSQASFFTMGSCFANELRAELMRRGKRVLPEIDPGLHGLFDPRAKEASSWGPWDERSNLQFYNTFSMRQEFEKAFGRWEQRPEDFWELRPPGQPPFWQDPYRRRVFAPSLASIQELTRRIDQNLRRAILQADAFVFTLGLTEVWKKRDNLLVACAEPGYCGGGGLHETWFHPSTYEENLANMRVILGLLAQHRPGAPIFVTVSPVALGRTFRPGVDVAIANMESKSILRAVAAALVQEFPGLRYFPSYELCIYDWERSFRDDGRHVRPEKVRQIMDQFFATWLKEDQGPTRAELWEKERAVPAWMAANLDLKHPTANAWLKEWIRGYDAVTRGQPCPDSAYMAMRQLHVAARGQLDEVVQKALSSAFPAPPLAEGSSPLFGAWSAVEQAQVVAELRQEGIAILPRRLDEAWVEALRTELLAQPMSPTGTQGRPLAERDVGAPRLLIDELAMIRLPRVRALIADPLIQALAGAYLGCAPVFDLLAGMLSFPVQASEQAHSQAAQRFHFDKDRIAFIKLFVYLTDVDEESGPHAFVPRSKVGRPASLWRDGRIPDAEIEAAWPGGVRRVTGPRGTVFLADTSHFHKGEPPRSRERLVFQIEYAASLFGRHYPLPFSTADFGPLPPGSSERLLMRLSPSA